MFSPQKCGKQIVSLPQNSFDMPKYIYQYENWTDFSWQNALVRSVLGDVRLLQGKISGQIHSLGFSSKEEKNLEMLTLDVLKSSEIEGV